MKLETQSSNLNVSTHVLVELISKAENTQMNS